MSLQKFGRNFRLTIDPKDGGAAIVISLPFTCRFWVNRNIYASLNNLSIDIYNLSLGNRKRIYQDRNDLQENIVNGQNLGRRSAVLEIGYGNLLYQVFSGDILQASSAREGVDIVTRIEAFTTVFDVASAQSNKTIAPTSLANLFKSLIGDFPNLQYGYVGDWPQMLPRSVVLNGNTWALIQQYSGGKCFIDNGKVYIMQDNEALANGEIPSIDESSGILETPRRESAFLTVTTLLEAGIKINQLVNINSLVEPGYNGQYKVVGIQHAGVISAAVSGDCRSTFSLNAPKFFSYTEVQGA
jgi:hypothetical protein